MIFLKVSSHLTDTITAQVEYFERIQKNLSSLALPEMIALALPQSTSASIPASGSSGINDRGAPTPIRAFASRTYLLTVVSLPVH